MIIMTLNKILSSTLIKFILETRDQKTFDNQLFSYSFKCWLLVTKVGHCSIYKYFLMGFPSQIRFTPKHVIRKSKSDSFYTETMDSFLPPATSNDVYDSLNGTLPLILRISSFNNVVQIVFPVCILLNCLLIIPYTHSIPLIGVILSN